MVLGLAQPTTANGYPVVEEQRPSRMLQVLRACGALARLMPELDALWGVPQRADYHPEVDTGAHMLLVIDAAASMQASLAARWAALLHDLGKGTTPSDVLPAHIGHEQRWGALVRTVCERLKVPNDCRDLALMAARDHGNIHRAAELRASTMVELFERCDALRKPDRFAELLQACEADHRGRLGFADRPYPQAAIWQAALAAARAVDAGALAAQQSAEPRDSLAQRIRDRVRAARVSAVAQALGRPAR